MVRKWEFRVVAAVAGAAVLAIGALVALHVSSRAMAADAAGAARLRRIAAVLDDPLALLARRSPGERGSGALLNTKRPRKPAPAAQPPQAEQGAPKMFLLRLLPPVIETPEAAPLLAPSEFLPSRLSAPEQDWPLTPAPGGEFQPPFVLVSGGGGGGGGGGPSPPTPAPEPATWAELVLGFLVLGTAMRRARRGQGRRFRA